MALPEYKHIQLESDGKTLTLKLNRPELHNAFNEEMIAEITNAFELFNNRDERIVVIRGNGKSFCAGADLNWMKKMKDYTEEENERDAKGLDKMFYSIYTCNKPVISIVHGGVFGGGTGILASSDIVISHKDTKFGFTEVRLGLVPAVISSYLVRKINFPALREFCITGGFFDAKQAKEMGLVNYIEEDDKAMEDRLLALKKQLFSVGPKAIEETKKLISYQLENILDHRRERAPKVIAKVRVSKEGQEGISAFLEKRKANFVLDI
ncbi:MAG: enoyl-CoA hydratase-related protein [Proteobacteria bacterium]|nr:enoyl-CoA hydratase-related protein [Pseudomonadota bacterium]